MHAGKPLPVEEKQPSNKTAMRHSLYELDSATGKQHGQHKSNFRRFLRPWKWRRKEDQGMAIETPENENKSNAIYPQPVNTAEGGRGRRNHVVSMDSVLIEHSQRLMPVDAFSKANTSKNVQMKNDSPAIAQPVEKHWRDSHSQEPSHIQDNREKRTSSATFSTFHPNPSGHKIPLLPPQYTSPSHSKEQNGSKTSTSQIRPPSKTAIEADISHPATFHSSALSSVESSTPVFEHSRPHTHPKNSKDEFEKVPETTPLTDTSERQSSPSLTEKAIGGPTIQFSNPVNRYESQTIPNQRHKAEDFSSHQDPDLPSQSIQENDDHQPSFMDDYNATTRHNHSIVKEHDEFVSSDEISRQKCKLVIQADDVVEAQSYWRVPGEPSNEPQSLIARVVLIDDSEEVNNENVEENNVRQKDGEELKYVEENDAHNDVTYSDSDSDDGPILYQENDDDDENEEEEEEEEVPISDWVRKIARIDSLAIHPGNKAHKDGTQSLPRDGWKQARTIISTELTRRLSQRPTAVELQQRNILKERNTEEEKQAKSELKRNLTRKLSMRPTVNELRKRRILHFSEYIDVAEVQDYDRRADKPWTRLTSADKAAIRKELNEFKSQEMEVHEESRQFTRFHNP
uniref:Phosphatase and actin regulator n=1 Tax=Eptatretus burgeri TaxID=7764 RepID=A0A8C4PX63_EPTBU